MHLLQKIADLKKVYRPKLGYKVQLHAWADASGLEIPVRHYPSGTSHSNPMEQTRFSPMILKWRTQPLERFDPVVQDIARTTAATDPTVKTVLDDRTHEAGRWGSKADLAQEIIERNALPGTWHSVIEPTPPTAESA